MEQHGKVILHELERKKSYVEDSAGGAAGGGWRHVHSPSQSRGGSERRLPLKVGASSGFLRESAVIAARAGFRECRGTRQGGLIQLGASNA